MCLLLTKLPLLGPRFSARLPEGCFCDRNQTGAPALRTPHVAHGVPTHSVSALKPSVLTAVDQMTAVDRILYRAAMLRFVRDVRVAERVLGRSLLCANAAWATLVLSSPWGTRDVEGASGLGQSPQTTQSSHAVLGLGEDAQAII